MKIAIRADASASIGLGHIKRCLSLAQAMARNPRGHEIIVALNGAFPATIERLRI